MPPARRDDNPGRTPGEARGGSGSAEPRGPGDVSDRRRGGGDRDRSEGRYTGPRLPDNGRTEPQRGPRPESTAPTRTESPAPRRDRAHDIFSRTAEGRNYRNGVILRNGVYVPNREIRHYFPHAYAYYPYYSPLFEAEKVYHSPYSFYFGVCPPYIYRQHTYYRPPAVVYIDVPVYENNVYRGYEGDDYYLYRDGARYDGRDSALNRAIDDIEEAFRSGDIERLVFLTDPNVRIAVYRKGNYEYTLNANDYLDLTRDAFRTMETVRFDINRIRERAVGIYVLSGRHVYENTDGDRRTVYVSFVLERVYGRWTITQVGTAPDRND